MAARGRAARTAGIRFERDVALHFNTVTTRSLAPGVWDDDGDLVIPGWTIEVKNYDNAQWRVPTWWAAVSAKARSHGTRPMLILKRRDKPLTEALVVCKLGDID